MGPAVALTPSSPTPGTPWNGQTPQDPQDWSHRGTQLNLPWQQGTNGCKLGRNASGSGKSDHSSRRPTGADVRDLEVTVDTGSTFTAVPGELLRRLGVPVLRLAQSELADGSNAPVEIGKNRHKTRGTAIPHTRDIRGRRRTQPPGCGHPGGGAPGSGPRGRTPHTDERATPLTRRTEEPSVQASEALEGRDERQEVAPLTRATMNSRSTRREDSPTTHASSKYASPGD